MYLNSKVSINGYVCLGKKYKGIYPSPFPSPQGIPIIAPFFADADARGYNTSGIFMHEYLMQDNSTQAKQILNRATQDVFQFQNYSKNKPSTTDYGVFNGNIDQFQANHVIVITWQDLLPSPYTFYVTARTVNL